MKQVLSVLAFLLFEFPISAAAVNVPLTIQEALYPGSVPGVTRTDEPFCQGVPFADSTAISNINALGLSGASAGQFRVLGTWPDGNVKWIKVCGILPALPAGGSVSVALITGSGNFGGPDLAVDNGGTITVTTGAATFVIKKANYNVIDSVVIGTTTVVVSSLSPTRGLVLAGPDPTAAYPGNVTCSPTSGGSACSTIYSSSNDAASTCLIEENGPVMAVIKCIGDYKDQSGHVYMHYTSREHFYKNKTSLKLTTALRNADYGASNTFATAYKGHRGLELRLPANLAGVLTYTIANDTAVPTIGTMSGSDDVYLYQGLSTRMAFEDNAAIVPYTPDKGYAIVKNGSNLHTGTSAQAPQGWCDIQDSNGVGIQVGVYQLAAYWPKGCEFAAGGSDVRIGILPTQNSVPYYTEWPQWNELTDLFINFHANAPAVLADDFLKFQHYLVARAPISHYNGTGALPQPLTDPAVEDSFTASTYATAVPSTIPTGNAWADPPTATSRAKDFGLLDTNWPLHIIRDFSWNLESEYRYGYMMTFLTRGMTGRWLEAAHWYHYQAEYMLPHSDGFNWRDHGPAGISPDIDGFGKPKATSTNANLGMHGANHNWKDQEHSHWYGQTHYYFLTGDEWQKDALLDQQKDWFVLPRSYQDGGSSGSNVVSTSGNLVTLTCCSVFPPALLGQDVLIGNPPVGYMVGSITDGTHLVLTTSAGTQLNQPIVWGSGMYNTRAAASQLFGVARFSEFLQTIGDPDYTAVQRQGINIFNEQVKSQLCVSGYPVGCDAGSVDNPSTWKVQGVSRTRGVPWGASGNSGNWCGVSHNYRVNSLFQASLLGESLLELRATLGPSWADYWIASDLAYGISQFALSEGFVDDLTGRWDLNGFRFGLALDVPNNCTPATEQYTVSTNGLLVTNVGSKPFRTDGTWNPGISTAPDGTGLFTINGVGYVIASVTDSNHLTLSKSAGIQSSVTATFREFDFLPQNTLSTFMHFATKYTTDGKTDWQTQLKINMQKAMAGSGLAFRDVLGYQLSRVIGILVNPTAPVLSTVPITGVVDNGGGSYTISWLVPAGATGYRIKWGPKAIVEWIGFDPGNNVFVGDPINTMNWFAAENVTGVPTPGISGAPQSMTIATGLSGLKAPNFSVKAYIPSSGATSGGGTPSLSIVSGNGQTGTPGQQLASALVVRATDAAGHASSGVLVTFAVTGGNGAVSASQVVTDGQGLASTLLTLGPSAGSNTVSATSASLGTITFTATGIATTLATPAAVIIVSGNGQTTTSGYTSSPLIVRVTDAGGNPVSGTTITFAVTSGGGTLSTSQSVTDSQGLASTILTLGNSAGINTVRATVGSLPAVTFTLTGTAPNGSATADITWTRQSRTAGWPSYVFWQVPQYDPLSQQTLFYAGPLSAQHGIYATDTYAYSSSANVFTHITGTGSSEDACPADTPTQPGDRHPGWQMAVDTTRNLLWLYSGVNTVCNGSYVTTNGTAVIWVSGATFNLGPTWNNAKVVIAGKTYTIASVTDASHLTLTSSAGLLTAPSLFMLAAPNTNPRQDMYYLQLNVTPASDTWRQVNTITLPRSNNAVAAMIYDPDDDVLFSFGYDSGANLHNNYVFCRTSENPTPGTPTAKQLKAGCSRPDDWNEVTPAGGIQPSGSYFPGMVYDSVTKKVILYGGGLPDGMTFFNQTWAYDIPTHTWVQKALTGTVPPTYVGSFTAQPAMAYNSTTNKVLYHQTGNTGAPADWQYDPVSDTWNKLTSAGSGATIDQVLAYDALTQKLVGWSLNKSTGQPEVWLGALATATVAGQPAKCDLNGDGLVDVRDVQFAVLQVLGLAPCTDVGVNGACNVNVTTVMSIIQASLGGVCH